MTSTAAALIADSPPIRCGLIVIARIVDPLLVLRRLIDYPPWHRQRATILFSQRHPSTARDKPDVLGHLFIIEKATRFGRRGYTGLAAIEITYLLAGLHAGVSDLQATAAARAYYTEYTRSIY